MKGTIFVSMKSKNNTQSVNLLVETNIQFFLISPATNARFTIANTIF